MAKVSSKYDPEANALAREKLAMLSLPARFVMSRFKEGAGALSLWEMAIVVDPSLPGIPLPPMASIYEASKDGAEVYRPVRKDRRFGPRKALTSPMEKRLDRDGRVLPELEERQEWRAALVTTRAVITELGALNLLRPVTVVGGHPDKWTTTALGERVMRLTSVSEWREHHGKNVGR